MSDQVPDKTKYELSGKTDTLALDYNMAALLCYLPVPGLNLAAAIVWLMTEPKSNLFVRFHAVQALMLAGVVTAMFIVVTIIGALGGIPVIGGIFSLISWLLWFGAFGLYFIVSVVLMLKCNQREMYKLPYLGELAEKYAS